MVLAPTNMASMQYVVLCMRHWQKPGSYVRVNYAQSFCVDSLADLLQCVCANIACGVCVCTFDNYCSRCSTYNVEATY